MNLQEVLRRYREGSPDADETARRYRELLDTTEAEDSDELRSFVDEMTSGGLPKPGEAPTDPVMGESKDPLQDSLPPEGLSAYGQQFVGKSGAEIERGESPPGGADLGTSQNPQPLEGAPPLTENLPHRGSEAPTPNWPGDEYFGAGGERAPPGGVTKPTENLSFDKPRAPPRPVVIHNHYEDEE